MGVEIIPITVRRKIARDYHCNKLSSSEIAEKYKVKENSVLDSGKNYPFESVVEINAKLLIKVNPEDYEVAMKTLEHVGIFTHEVAPNFELLEYYESSIK